MLVVVVVLDVGGVVVVDGGVGVVVVEGRGVVVVGITGLGGVVDDTKQQKKVWSAIDR